MRLCHFKALKEQLKAQLKVHKINTGENVS